MPSVTNSERNLRRKAELEAAAMNAALNSETLDVTLPGHASKKVRVIF